MKTCLILAVILLSGVSVSTAAEPTSPQIRLDALGLKLPEIPKAIANYVPAVRHGNLLYLSGQIARGPDGKFLTGKVGREVSEAQATEAARLCALQLLAVLKTETGDLSKVKRIVRVGGFVNCTDDFTAQSKVVNGASDMFVSVFGDAGRHARAAVGVNSLPAGAPVEIELIAEVAE